MKGPPAGTEALPASRTDLVLSFILLVDVPVISHDTAKLGPTLPRWLDEHVERQWSVGRGAAWARVYLPVINCTQGCFGAVEYSH